VKTPRPALLLALALVAGLPSCENKEAKADAEQELENAAWGVVWHRRVASRSNASAADAVDYSKALADFDIAKAKAEKAGVKNTATIILNGHDRAERDLDRSGRQ
jgi:hypothetical protein